MSKLAFITGITGQDGSYLAELLLEKKYTVYGIVRRTSLLYSSTRIDDIRDRIHLRYGDLSDGAGLSNYIHEILSTNENFSVFEIYNLAAQSHVKISFEIPEYTADIDGIGTMRLLEIIRTLSPSLREKIRFYQAGTSEMYGKVLETPQNEKTPFNPISPYAAAKLYAYYMVKCYRDGYGLHATNGILFNHESYRRGANFLTMKVVNGVKDIMADKHKCIEIGNLDSKRDWGHAKDYVRGMWLMLQQEKSDDYVLATEKMYSVREFIEKAFSHKNITIRWEGEGIAEVGIDENNITRVKVNPKYYRPCEVDLLWGDATKAKTTLGWTMEYDTLDKLISDMFQEEER